MMVPLLAPTARILVVDDEHLIRRVLVQWLRRWGHEVVEADSAQAALAVMEANPAEILLVDLIMPVHTGLWLIERVRERWPSATIIVESGAQEEANIMSAKRAGAVAFLPKPFGREMIYQAIEQAIQDRSRPDSATN
jgi:DNA-binding NtrC family response regulator